jgi:hypothetical protein
MPSYPNQPSAIIKRLRTSSPYSQKVLHTSLFIRFDSLTPATIYSRQNAQFPDVAALI